MPKRTIWVRKSGEQVIKLKLEKTLSARDIAELLIADMVFEDEQGRFAQVAAMGSRTLLDYVRRCIIENGCDSAPYKIGDNRITERELSAISELVKSKVDGL